MTSKSQRIDLLGWTLIAAHTAILLAVLVGPFYIGSGPSLVQRHAAQSHRFTPPRQPPRPESDSTLNASVAPNPIYQKGVVWLNLPSHIYHYPGYRWFGTTKSGKYMQEADALAEGNRAALNERRPRWFDAPLEKD